MASKGVEVDKVLTAEDFAPHLGKTFHPQGQPHVLTFVKLDSRDWPGWPADIRKPFSLILRSAPGAILAEGFYRFTVEDGPCFDLHIMPIHTPTREHQDYQVAFN
jgi:hypothetical protein